MRVKRVSADDVKLYDLTKVKLKTAGNTQVVQFTAGNNQSCPVSGSGKNIRSAVANKVNERKHIGFDRCAFLQIENGNAQCEMKLNKYCICDMFVKRMVLKTVK